jgi:hypothetical protein
MITPDNTPSSNDRRALDSERTLHATLHAAHSRYLIAAFSGCAVIALSFLPAINPTPYLVSIAAICALACSFSTLTSLAAAFAGSRQAKLEEINDRRGLDSEHTLPAALRRAHSHYLIAAFNGCALIVQSLLPAMNPSLAAVAVVSVFAFTFLTLISLATALKYSRQAKLEEIYGHRLTWRNNR